MTTRLKAPEGTTSASVEGHDYTVDEDGFLEVDHGEHVAILAQHGFYVPAPEVEEAEEVLTYSTEVDNSEDPAAEVPPHNAAGVVDVVANGEAPAATFEAPVVEETDEVVEETDEVVEETDEVVEETDEVVELDDPGECPDFDKFPNRGALAEWLVANGVPDADATESRDALEQSCRDRHAVLVSEFEKSKGE